MYLTQDFRSLKSCLWGKEEEEEEEEEACWPSYLSARFWVLFEKEIENYLLVSCLYVLIFNRAQNTSTISIKLGLADLTLNFVKQF
jgi:hypothetical protein